MKGLLDPVAWCWFCLIALGVWLFRRPERGLGVLLLVVALGWSLMEWFAVPARLLASREEPYVGRGVAGLDEDAESFDAVVMLGGVLMPSPEVSGAQYLDSVDRVLTAVALARQSGKPLVMGGGIAGEAGSEREPEYTKRLLAAWGVTDVVIEGLGNVKNTRDEALMSAEMARERGWQRVALVTSAWHLERSQGAFRQVGLPHVPVASDFRGTSELQYAGGGWLPRAESALLVRLWLTEWVGERYYEWKGWWRDSD